MSIAKPLKQYPKPIRILYRRSYVLSLGFWRSFWHLPDLIRTTREGS